MAELNSSPNSSQRKTAAPRIDLTPMVDLGFLLITFFMFTTTLAREKALVVHMPTNDVAQMPTVIPEESTITLIATKGHKLIYYAGALRGKNQLNDCTLKNATQILLNKKAEIRAFPPSYSAEARKLHVLIKPMDDCSYDDIVHLLDAMLIVNVPYYAIVDVTDDEKDLVSSFYPNN